MNDDLIRIAISQKLIDILRFRSDFSVSDSDHGFGPFKFSITNIHEQKLRSALILPTCQNVDRSVGTIKPFLDRVTFCAYW